MALYKWTVSIGVLFVSIIGGSCFAQVAAPAAYPTSAKINYVREWTATAPEQSPTNLVTRPLADVKQNTQYFDGLGRPLQIVSRQMSPTGKDMVTSQVYDAFGREQYKYQPFAANVYQAGDTANNGNFKLDPFQQQATFSTTQYPGETYFYGQTNFEASPMDRVQTGYAAGSSWVGSSRGATTQYLANTISDSLRIWNVALSIGAIPSNSGIYPSGQVYKTVVTDEQGHQTIEYKDKEGHVLLKKVQSATSPGAAHVGWLCTYYIYDDINNLRFVIPPRASEVINTTSGNWSVSQSIADELCFRYEYDARNRMIIKKIPGAGEMLIVYDARDRLAMSQDSNLRKTHIWQVTKYDNQNRPDSMGLLTDTNNRVYHQNLASSSTNYPVTSGSNFEYMTRTFYDDYSWTSSATSGTPVSLGTSLATTYTTNSNYFITSYNAGPVYAVPIAQNPMTRGLVTGTITKAYHSGSFYFFAVHFYDDHNRVVQTQGNNYTWAVDTTTTQYDFSGKGLRTLITHAKKNNVVQYHKVLTKLSYDAGGRLTSTWKRLDAATADQLIDSMQYNELGQLQNKYLGNFVDSQAYVYNIRGWMTSINKSYLSSTSTTPRNYFGMELGYDKSTAALTSTTYKGLQYNGNIAGTIWKSAGDGVNRQYDFLYNQKLSVWKRSLLEYSYHLTFC